MYSYPPTPEKYGSPVEYKHGIHEFSFPPPEMQIKLKLKRKTELHLCFTAMAFSDLHIFGPGQTKKTLTKSRREQSEHLNSGTCCSDSNVPANKSPCHSSHTCRFEAASKRKLREIDAL